MNYKTFKKIKILITSFISAIIAMAVVLNNMILALTGILIGILFLFFVKKKIKIILVDERIKSVGGYAARLTYIISTSVIAFLSLVFILSGRRTGEIQMEALGIILSYVTLLNLAIYSMSYKYYLKKYGDEDDK